MGQQTLPYPPPPSPAELPRVASLCSYRCLLIPKNVLKGKPVLFGVIQVKRSKNVLFSEYPLKPNFDKHFQIIMSDLSFERSRRDGNDTK